MTNEEGEVSRKHDWDEYHFEQWVREHVEKESKDSAILDLKGVVFPGQVDFKNFKELRSFSTIHLSASVFNGPVHFQDFHFTGDVFFENVSFRDEAYFIRCKFDKKAYFFNSKFLKAAQFGDARFNSGVRFNGSRFADVVYFSDSEFSYETTFQKVRFGSYAYFPSCKFLMSTFREAEFLGEANFQYTDFKMRADFRDTTFFQDASFEGGRSKLTPSPEARPDGKFHRINFSGASFRGEVDFTDREFTKETDFSNTTFVLAPKFHNCKFHQDTNFDDSNFEDTKGSEAARAYRTLKLAMENVRAWDEAAMFYALEQKSLRHQPSTTLAVKIFSLLYDLASSYGRSFIRPLFWLGVITGVSFVAYAMLINAEGKAAPGDAFVFTIEQIVRPFFIWTEAYKLSGGVEELWKTSSFLLRLIATIQSLLSLGLVTLFILAVRRRFKMG